MYSSILQKNYFLFILIVLSLPAHCTENLDQFYSTAFLKNYTAVRESLIQQGFKKITYITADNLTIHGLFLSRSNAQCNVIVCAGFFPGKKEGMATFFALLPDYCNILFFDARGRGESDGSFLRNLWRYGVDEHKDITGAISWINNNNNLPIVIGGTCCGVFNAAHSLLDLTNKNALAQSKVKGLFFDSGWGSVMTMSQSSPMAHIKRTINKITNFIYGSKKNNEDRMIYKLSFAFIKHCFNIGHFICARPLIMPYEKRTNLFDKIKDLTLPIFFIHSYDDYHAHPLDAIKLSELAPNNQSWWIEKSSHAKHYLIHRALYKEKLVTFIQSVIQ